MELANKLKRVTAAALIGGTMVAWASSAQAQSVSWTGYYLGGGVGSRWSDVDWSTESIYAPVAFPAPGYYTPLYGPNATLGSSGFRGTLFGGYNWQSGNMIWGVEADLGIANSKETLSGTPGVNYFGNTPGDRFSTELGLDGSFRLRGGVLVLPSLLAYATGGLALQQVTMTSSCGAQTTPTFCNFGIGLGQLSESTTATLIGWTLGGGLEAALNNHWTARAEYRFSDFGTYDHQFFSGNSQLQWTGGASISTQILNVGLSYKF